jgi:hypothetical protein
MKKILFHLIFLVPLWGLANSVRIKIINNSNTTFVLGGYKVNHGKACVSDSPVPGPANIEPGTYVVFYTSEACGATGNDGYVEYIAQRDGKSYQVYIGFDVPFIGDNEYDPRASHPFFIKHISGGDGSDVFITFEVTGGPVSVPPPLPLVLPAKGNRIISGSFIWDADVAGMPSSEEWRSAFSVIAKAPKYLKLNNDNTGPDTYGNQKGSFEELQMVGTVVFSLENNETNTTINSRQLQTTIANSKRIIYYRILYLPEGVPVSIHAEPGVAWVPGVNSPLKPDKPYSEYIAYCIEKNKTKAGVNYFVEAAWFYSNNAGNGSSTTDDAAARKILSGKQVRPSGFDIVFGNRGFNNQNGNGISKVPLSGNNSSTSLNKGKSTSLNTSTNTNNQIKTGNQLKTNLPAQQKINVKQKAVNKNGIQ